MAPPLMGHGLAVEVALEVPRGSLAFWGDAPGEVRRHDLADRDAVRRATCCRSSIRTGCASRWSKTSRRRGRSRRGSGSPVAVERQIRGLYGARLWERDAAATATFLDDDARLPAARRRERLDALRLPRRRRRRRHPRGARRAARRWGVGAIHHLAWRVDDEEHQLAVRAQVESGGRQPTPVIDRFWFKSVYFKEPGGVLFELATDGPGFAVDEDPGAPRRDAGAAAVARAAARADRAGVAPTLVAGAHASRVNSRLPNSQLPKKRLGGWTLELV